jgi:hypothetical protein
MTFLPPPMGHECGPFEAQLIAQVVESLQMHMMDNAKFLAERLHAGFPNEVLFCSLSGVTAL